MIRASEMCPSLCRTGLSGSIIPADSAQPHMKETISSIQTKLDHLYNRTQVNSIGHITNLSAEARYRLSLCKYLLVQVHDQTLVNINNHLVNGGSNALDGGSRGGGNQLNTLKQEILTELERRVSLSCSACQVNLSVQPSETAANISVMCLLAISVVVKCFYFPAR